MLDKNVQRVFFPDKGSPIVGDKIGVEVEVEFSAGDQGDRNNEVFAKFWRATADGSLRNGVEYVMRNPVSTENLPKALKSLQDYLSESKIVWSNRTSTHIHINAADLNMRQVACWLTCWWIVEDLIISMMPEERHFNHFCLSASWAEGLVEMVSECFKKESIWVFTDNNYRYSACNVVSLSKFGSLEFRVFPGSKDATTIQKWCDILLNIKRVSLTYEDPIKIIQDFSLRGPEDFVENLTGLSPSDLPAGWKDLLFTGMRTAQELAYCRNDWINPIPKKGSYMDIGVLPGLDALRAVRPVEEDM